MRDTANLIYESVLNTEDPTVLNSYGENTIEFEKLNTLNEEYINLLGLTPEKVVVNVTRGRNYLVEYTGNLEKMMQDQHVSLVEALEMVAEANGIDENRIYVVADESCIKKINFSKVNEAGIHFVRK